MSFTYFQMAKLLSSSKKIEISYSVEEFPKTVLTWLKKCEFTLGLYFILELCYLLSNNLPSVH